MRQSVQGEAANRLHVGGRSDVLHGEVPAEVDESAAAASSQRKREVSDMLSDRHAIIRGLWGDHTAVRRNLGAPYAHLETLRGVAAAADRDDVIDRIYVYGDANEEYLRICGYTDIIKLHSRPWVTPKNKMGCITLAGGAIRYGCNHWAHKLLILRAALEDHDSVVWMDFDMHQMQDRLPKQFWETLDAGPVIQASLYDQPRWIWAAGWRYCRNRKWRVPGTVQHAGTEREQERAACIVPGCGWLYVRGKDTIEELIDIYHERPRWHDHQIVACWLDRKYGGKWIGVDKYVESGYHTKWFCYGRQVRPPKHSDVYWASGGVASASNNSGQE